MGSEALQKIFKTLADPTRIRILALLEKEELAVQDLMDVLGMPQSRVSRHLGILREAGLLRDRRDGTFVYYRFLPPDAGAWRDAWDLVCRARRDDPTRGRDQLALARVIEARASRTRAWFDSVGPEWDALRKAFNDDLLRAHALTRLVPPGLRVADVGTGTGILAIELARLGLRVIAIDHSEAMLEAARRKLETEGVTDVELRRGEIAALPLRDAEVDAAFAHMVLHYLPSPADGIREMARVVRPDGRVVIVDFVSHELEWMRQELGVLWLGFELEDVRQWLSGAGLRDVRVDAVATRPRGRDLPAAFIASARKPA
ncbi:MAG: metalloregulator ArsR/SmtB family transcription factor [Deltaproteobacteria bacterium]|nr:MAG: metalloregulator ArsR/SmtB family transcription factor [Deltaproteobacteria bacterium]